MPSVHKNATVSTTTTANAATTSVTTTAASNNNNINVKENTETEFADSAEYLAPIKELSKAYADYFTQHSVLSSQEKSDTLNLLWGKIGECQKRLPRYVLQEFFERKPFSPLPDFKTEPNREECSYYWDDNLLDLDELGCSNLRGLYKGKTDGACTGGPVKALRACLRDDPADAAAINHLCQLRETGLRNIIDCLRTHELALTLIPHDKHAETTQVVLKTSSPKGNDDNPLSPNVLTHKLQIHSKID